MERLVLVLGGLMERQGWSQGALARRTGISQPTLSRILSDEGAVQHIFHPGQAKLAALAEALGVDAVTLYAAAGYQVSIPEDLLPRLVEEARAEGITLDELVARKLRA